MKLREMGGLFCRDVRSQKCFAKLGCCIRGVVSGIRWAAVKMVTKKTIAKIRKRQVIMCDVNGRSLFLFLRGTV
jgi:hypothetical protein